MNPINFYENTDYNEYMCRKHRRPNTLADYAYKVSNGTESGNTFLEELKYEGLPNNLKFQISISPVYNNGPIFSELAMIEKRLKTFNRWPKDKIQTPLELSRAGFFLSSKNDRVICFYCGGGLSNWEQSDEPWEQHLLWYGNCGFLRTKKTID